MFEKEPKINSCTEKESLEKLMGIVKNIQHIEIHNPEVAENLEKDDEILIPEAYVKEVMRWGNYLRYPKDTKSELSIFINGRMISQNEWAELTSRNFVKESGIDVASWVDRLEEVEENSIKIDANNFYSAFMPEGKPGRKVFDTDALVKAGVYPDSFIELSKKYAELREKFPRLVEILFKQGDELLAIDQAIQGKYLFSDSDKYIGLATRENKQKFQTEIKDREEWKKRK